jgi:hypothetical protein
MPEIGRVSPVINHAIAGRPGCRLSRHRMISLSNIDFPRILRVPDEQFLAEK